MLNKEELNKEWGGGGGLMVSGSERLAGCTVQMIPFSDGND